MHLSRTLIAVFLITSLGGVLSTPTSAAPGFLSFGPLGKAERAFEDGRLEDALSLYQEILAANPDWNEKRGEAVWHIALIRLGAEGELADHAAGCRLLKEFAAAFETSPHDVELRAFRVLCVAAGTARTQVAELEQQLESVQQNLTGARQDAMSKERQRERLDARVAELEGELRRVRAELSRKDALLQEIRGDLSRTPSGRRPR